MRWFAATFLGLAIISAAHAETPETSNYYPTLEEFYNDCKTAVAAADTQDYQSFYDSRCAVSMSTALGTSMLLLFNDGFLVPTFEEQKIRQEGQKEVLDAQSSRVCALRFLSKKDPEIQLARRFITKVDAKRESKNFAKQWRERSGMHFLYALRDCSKNETKD